MKPTSSVTLQHEPPSQLEPIPYPWLDPLIELVVILLWTGIVTASILDLSPSMTPKGGEFLMTIPSHHVWTRFQECGLCALWNDSVRGGAPALVDVHSAPLHPIVIGCTLLFGVLAGAKIATALFVLVAGLAQWWLGFELKLSQTARLWTACIAISGGHLLGRLDGGSFALIPSTAACALLIPALVRLWQRPTIRSAILLGIILASAALAGQAYMQIGALLLVPAMLIYPRTVPLRVLGIRLVQASIIGALLAAPFLVPFLHFWPNFGKPTDSTFRDAQNVAYIPLNLVISNTDFFRINALEKAVYPYLNTLYIGWIPVLLAGWGLFFVRSTVEARRNTTFFCMAVLAFLIASASPFRWLIDSSTTPDTIKNALANVRNPALIAGLSITPLLALAGQGLDHAMRLLAQVSLRGQISEWRFDMHIQWIVAVPLIIALSSTYSFAHTWGISVPIPGETRQVLDALRTPDKQWVNPPFGELFWLEEAAARGYKLSIGMRMWDWADRKRPDAYYEATRYTASANPIPEGVDPKPVADLLSIRIYRRPGKEYAAVTYPDGSRTICTATGMGGDIDVTCDLTRPGRLEIRENTWTGWSASVARTAVPLNTDTQWLSVGLNAGHSVVQFRYRPWDAPLGVLLMIIGLIVSILLWRGQFTGVARLLHWMSDKASKVRFRRQRAAKPALDDAAEE